MVTKQHSFKTDKDYWTYYPFLLNGLAKGELLFVEAGLIQAVSTVINKIFTRLTFLNFQIHAQNAMLTSGGFGDNPANILHCEISVRRDFIVADTMLKLSSLSDADLRKAFKVKIIGEEADDAGGVRKEFFLIVMRKILQREYWMFSEDEESHLVWFSGLSAEFCEREQFRQLGKLVGLAVYNSVIVPFPFPLALYKVLVFSIVCLVIT